MLTRVILCFLDTFTVSQAINALGFGKFQVMLSLFTGLCWMADSMEMMILSILSPALHCDWKIDEYQQAFLTTVRIAFECNQDHLCYEEIIISS